MKKQLIATVALAGILAWGLTAHAVPINSVGDGNWTNTATWSTASIPTINDDVTITNGCTVTISDTTTHDVKSVTIETNAVLTHTGNGSTEQYKVILNIASNLTVETGGLVDADGKGYSTGGPGAGSGGNSGGGHGGEGGMRGGGTPQPGGTTHGSIKDPSSLGGRGGVGPAGGGAVLLTVGGNTVIDGEIRSNGTDEDGGPGGGGAGGTVRLTSLTLSGGGGISVDGGNGGGSEGGGGGGRIAVILTTGTSIGGVTLSAAGGTELSASITVGM